MARGLGVWMEELGWRLSGLVWSTWGASRYPAGCCHGQCS